jgi:hypothetical protein
MTTPPRDIQPAHDHLEGVLEASCATLVALEAINGRLRELPTDARTVQRQIAEAINALREAIVELRVLHDADASGLAFGFVVGASPT